MKRSGRILAGATVAAVLSNAAASIILRRSAVAIGPTEPSPLAAPLQTGPAPSVVWTPPPPIIRRVDNDDMRIAITFDACATQSQGYGFDRGVYQVLLREHVPATLFVSGRWVEFHPDAMAELTANPLIEFANHSYDHPHMAKLSADEMAAEIDRTEAALAHYGRRSVAFRPPFGTFDERVLDVARSRQLPAVLWDVVSGDPGKRASAPAIVRTVLKETRSGSIIIFHINARAPQTAVALPPILRELRARGFEFVHVSTLLASGTNDKVPTPVAAPATMPAVSPGVQPAALPSQPPAPPSKGRRIEDDDDAVMPPSLPGEAPARPAPAPGAFVPASASRVSVGRP
jgi:peptidoglycan/xylan/chitin deacetylase (PgdA/CDA1 family)